ncbi:MULTISPECIES: hypothetical protein [Burkholderia]|uniref:hypothetical protein n=1 Tax=Burkholderia TaxID=32008 RepID=UPI00064E3354|nr:MULTISPECIES: hypothetical protein [Burkholderia]KML19727.1 hypothetical protein VL00_05800 [Burkholderia cepacia]KMN59568.1 hypothetical protein VK92_15430 [Burkholderia sp. LK4]
MRKYSATTRGDAEKILAVMERGCRYSAAALAAVSKVPTVRLRQALGHLTEARRVVCHVDRKRNQYALPGVSSAQPAPELSARLTTHLTGYDQQARQFAALCMLARAPVTTIPSHEATDEKPAPCAPSKTR